VGSHVTTLVVSHRMATATLADEVIVLDAGRVVEQGSHGDLIARNGRYASLYQDQRSA
jgi:ATP-binding cassette subfamily B protein